MKRRKFLTVGSAGIAGFVLPDLAARAAPCPPPVIQVDGGSPVTTSCTASSGASFRVTSAVGGTLLPFTVGHPFKQGDIPAGQSIGSNVANFQADVRNRWQDGSAKFAVLSGRQTLTANTPAVISVQAAGAAAGGANIAEPTPAFLASNVSVTLTGAGAGTYTPQAAATAGVTAWNRSTARKVREFLGPVMSEFHYYSPTSDAHLTIWWHIRVYSDRSEVETIVEQGWTKVAAATAKSYTVTVNVGGSQRYSATINHRHHARWSRRDWIGTDPQITPTHDRAYMGSTKMVPNYAPITIAAAMLNTYAQSAAPMTIGNFEPDGTQTGSHSFLGILPEWEAAYVISGDVRAYRAMLANEQASNCCSYGVGPGGGSDGFVQRDESTGLPVSPTDYQNDSYDTGGSLVVGTGGSVWTTDPAHAWSAGYLAYLTTGRWFSLETCQHQAGVEFLATSNYDHDNVRIAGGHMQDRGVAWTMRTAGAALAITPDSGSTLRAKFITFLQDNIAAWRANEVGHNNLGIRQRVFNNVDYGPAPYGSAGTFQMYFLTQTFAFARDIAAHALSTTAQTQFTETVAFHCSLPVGMLGTRPGGFCYKQAANYGLVVGPSVGTFYSSFGAWYDAAVAAGQLSNDACAPAGALTGGNFPFASSYWGNFLPAIAYAVDAGVAGAAAAYSRMTSASNWNTFYSDLPSAPQWAILPR